ncbi:hypothetical protein CHINAEXTREME_14665 [Halobiforma lacisalsi AJ5]|uniref:MYXO-CTERM domain-containing protein n=1 Tax=Natronobacterium lacisalsi AJ5 TaxID=358396 RepID=M0L143_NATLA|nr:hypothetical protein [Halobiforma lacisalsi]APW98940.1 hypothetical protein CHINAEXTREME_14665 [Halobiforma lacisalsi AJ5]EMA27266.1 hypothetical protein C445_20770 [Halobiforma lacisalsi AJ5]
MPETEQQDKTLSEVVVKEAVGKGLDSPLRDSILEAVEESEGGSSSRLPVAGAVFGLGAALGYLAGRSSEDLDLSGRSLEELEGLESIEGVDIEEPEIIEDVMESEEEAEAEPDGDEPSEEADESSLLSRLVLGLALLGAAVLLRRRLSEGEEEEWEPIEEFEPATDIGSDEEEEEAEEEEQEAEEEEEAMEGDEEAESDEAEE